ncbi:hypothetical protein GIB67_038379 [Kingdonia uniflora]|uniref:Uncharacterized protein n=1 Tax=Kingdonia uniflora TaxID=39325 RepID=A0A7J7NPK3_9MAGN|nr:hypothetical protein GIB67_038379 [Kingdonia uniflora]
MGSSQGLTFFVDGSSSFAREVYFVDCLPVYVKELIAGGAAGAFSKTAVASLERIKTFLQVLFRPRDRKVQATSRRYGQDFLSPKRCLMRGGIIVKHKFLSFSPGT